MSRAKIAPVLSASLHYIPGRAVDAYEKGEQVCLSEMDLVRAVNHVNEASGLPRVSAPRGSRGVGQ